MSKIRLMRGQQNGIIAGCVQVAIDAVYNSRFGKRNPALGTEIRNGKRLTSIRYGRLRSYGLAQQEQ